MRLCADYGRLNSLSAADAYPLPQIDDIIDRIGTAKYITTIDLTGRSQLQPQTDTKLPLLHHLDCSNLMSCHLVFKEPLEPSSG